MLLSNICVTDKVGDIYIFRGEDTVFIPYRHLIKAVGTYREDLTKLCMYVQLSDVCCILKVMGDIIQKVLIV
jgi:hypothetical protein